MTGSGYQTLKFDSKNVEPGAKSHGFYTEIHGFHTSRGTVL
jgi:hypothetical protein